MTPPPPPSSSLPPCGLFEMQYLLGAGGSVSGDGGHAAVGFDELWHMLLSMGALLEMDNMQHDDESQLQRLYWLPQSDTNQIQPEETKSTKPRLTLFFKNVVLCVADSNECLKHFSCHRLLCLYVEEDYGEKYR